VIVHFSAFWTSAVTAATSSIDLSSVKLFAPYGSVPG
jgi:hypothetical protein